MSIMSEEQVEKVFNKYWLPDPRLLEDKDYARHYRSGMDDAKKAFQAAFSLLLPIIEKQNERLEDLKNGVLKYYDSCYKEASWNICCNGMDCGCLGKPSDPEYYIYQDLKMIETTLAWVESEMAKMGKIKGEG